MDSQESLSDPWIGTGLDPPTAWMRERSLSFSSKQGAKSSGQSRSVESITEGGGGRETARIALATAWILYQEQRPRSTRTRRALPCKIRHSNLLILQQSGIALVEVRGPRV